MKAKLFSIFFCLYLFWESILYTVLGQGGQELDGGIMRMVLVSVFAISLYFYLAITPRIKGEGNVLTAVVIFGLLFYATRFFHETSHDCLEKYNGQILRWGADSIPACLIGMTLHKLKDYSLIYKILPWLCLLLTPFMAYSTLTMGTLEGQLHVDGGFNYQIIAYQMAILCCLSIYFTFIRQGKKKFILKVVMLPVMLIQAACCVMSGGRGGVVLLLIYALYMMYYLYTRKKMSLLKILLGGVGLLTISYILADYLGVFDSAGFMRSSNLVNDEDRFELWREYLPYIEKYLLFGWGLGGDYFTWGFYSHNIFIDFLLETGLVGTAILCCTFYLIYKRLFRLTALNEVYIIVIIFFIYGIVMNMFSGYWITTSTNWLSFGIAMTYWYAYKRV